MHDGIEKRSAFYCTANGSSVRAMLDVSKGFDFVDYFALFLKFISRGISPAITRFLLNTNTNKLTCITWNDMLHEYFVSLRRAPKCD